MSSISDEEERSGLVEQRRQWVLHPYAPQVTSDEFANHEKGVLAGNFQSCLAGDSNRFTNFIIGRAGPC
jgi:hypothetical protein